MTSLSSTPRPSDLLLLGRDASEIFSENGEGVNIPSSRPTPLIGTWADESWPLNSRQASEMILAEVQRQRSSVIFEDEEGNVVMENTEEDEQEMLDDVDDYHSEGCSELNEAMSVAQPSTEDVGDESPLQSPTHVSRCYTYDPYNITEGYVLKYCCYCEACNAKNNSSFASSPSNQDFRPAFNGENIEESQNPSAPAPPKALGASPLLSSNGSVGYDAQYHQHQEVYQEQQEDWDAPTPRVQHHIPAPRSSGGFATHSNTMSTPVPPPIHHVPSSARTLNRDGLLPPFQTSVQATPFMPPPPPPRIMTLVQEEEGNPAASGVFYHMLTRWYSRVVDNQAMWVGEADLCPAPNKELYSFEEWSDRVSGWWYTHFEHMQKKQPRFAPSARRVQ